VEEVRVVPQPFDGLLSMLLDERGKLMANAGQVVPTDTLIDRVWGPVGDNRDMLKQLVSRLRRKIEPDPSNPVYLETVIGVGYEVVAPD
jgi:DNA-binding response OmpR family regulator